jgi:23S rRNA (cytosine1962-C5)-methyltransferase
VAAAVDGSFHTSQDALVLDQALAALPAPSEQNVTVRVKRKAVGHLRRGHPWLFDEAIDNQSGEGAAGDLAVLFDDKRKLLALGLYDPGSPIRVKVLHRGKAAPIDDAFFAARVQQAIARREPLLATNTDGYRVVHGENDQLPGLVIDRYADTLVVKLYSAAWVPRLRQVLPPAVEALRPARVLLRLSRAVARERERLSGLEDGALLGGAPPSDAVVFRENGLRFECDPVRGQKTGFFLDQRDNRARVGERSRGRDVLNVFSYSGGFSLYAARGGATRVTSLDVSRPALDAAERNFALNEDVDAVRACVHDTICADAFDALESLADDGRQWDVVVVDPPSFAQRKDDVERALRSYRRLARLGLAVTRPGGLLVLASCSSRVTAEAFRENAEAAARDERRSFVVEEETGHALDHPIEFAEGAYLKCLFARV